MTVLRRRQVVAASAAAVMLLTLAARSHAQAEAPLRVILPVSAGAGVDTIVRTAQDALSRALKQPIVLENLPGAGGITGTAQLVRSAPDGKTIAFVSNNHAVNPNVFKKMPFDSLNDITPISVVGESPFVLVVNPAKLPVRDAKELAAALKAKPGGYNFGSSGNGTILHLAAEMFVDAAGVSVKHIPYKGTGPMLTDIIGGQIEFGVSSVPSVQAHLKSGALRAVGAMGASRIASLPDLPTMKEQGFPDVVIGGWFAAIGPKGFPAAEVKRIHAAIVNAFNAPEVREAMLKQDNAIRPSSPEEAAAFMKSEQTRYGQIVQKADIKLD